MARQGERHGWRRIKNRLERFLTALAGPWGERHGWQRIKNRLERFLSRRGVGLSPPVSNSNPMWVSAMDGSE